MTPDRLAEALMNAWGDIFGRRRKWSTEPVTKDEWCELGERVDILVLMNTAQIEAKELGFAVDRVQERRHD